MATADFRDDGQTENQRLYRLGASKAPSPKPSSKDPHASRFASSFLEANSGALEMMRASGAGSPLPASESAPNPDRPDRLEVVRRYDELRQTPFDGTPDEAAELERLIQQLR
jgi:hypothetical protein